MSLEKRRHFIIFHLKNVRPPIAQEPVRRYSPQNERKGIYTCFPCVVKEAHYKIVYKHYLHKINDQDDPVPSFRSLFDLHISNKKPMHQLLGVKPFFSSHKPVGFQKLESASTNCNRSTSMARGSTFKIYQLSLKWLSMSINLGSQN